MRKYSSIIMKPPPLTSLMQNEDQFFKEFDHELQVPKPNDSKELDITNRYSHFLFGYCQF
jgi:hypothetical protein